MGLVKKFPMCSPGLESQAKYQILRFARVFFAPKFLHKALEINRVVAISPWRVSAFMGWDPPLGKASAQRGDYDRSLITHLRSLISFRAADAAMAGAWAPEWPLV